MGCGWPWGGGGGGGSPYSGDWDFLGNYTYEDFSSDSLEFNLGAVVLPALTHFIGFYVQVVTPFGGGVITDYDLALGTGDDYEQFQEFTPVVDGSGVVSVSGQSWFFNELAAMNIFLSMRSAGAGLDSADQGEMNVWLMYAAMPPAT